MNEKPEALVLADIIDSDFDSDWMYEVGYERISAELRRLHAENERLTDCLEEANDQAEHFEREWYLRGDLNDELLEVLRLAVDAHGLMMMSDPPQEAWKVWEVESKARTLLAKAEGMQ